MANVLAKLFQDTADAIRDITGEAGTMKPMQFPEKIRAIQTGGTGGAEAELHPLTVTENGIYYPKENVELGKTYTLKNEYTQEELQVLFNACTNISSDGTTAYLVQSELCNLSIQSESGLFTVMFISSGVFRVFVSEEIGEYMGVSTTGWHNLDVDTFTLTPLENVPSVAIPDEIELYVDNITQLNPLFVLNEFDGFSVVGVNVTPTLEELTVTENGTYKPNETDGFSEVTVNVPETVPELEEITITENGTYTPSETDGYSKITVNVPSESANGGSGGNSGGGGTNGEANLISLTATKNGVYHPIEMLETGKTYTLGNDFTQEELQSFYEASLYGSEDGMYAFLLSTSDAGENVTLGVMYYQGGYVLYISDGHIWLPEEFASQMGLSAGWNFGSDVTDLTPAEIPTVTIEDDYILYTGGNLTALNPLFELKEYDGFSHVEVQVTNSEGRSVKVAEGSYTPTSETEIITINHNLGFVPDMIIIRGIGKPTAVMQLTSGTFFSPAMVQPSDITSYYHVCQNLNTGGFTLGTGKADFRENNGLSSYVNNVNGISFDVGSSGFVQHMPGAKYTWTAFGNMMT